jgi:hypothetical protein
MTRLFIILLILMSSLMADVKSTTGQIKFDTQSDNQSEMTLNGTGLGIGVTPSANLHVKGNAIISSKVFVGGSSGSSNLNVNGTLGYGFQTVSSNTFIGESSIVLVDSSSDNITITLPYAGNVAGRQYQIKKISTSNSVWVSGGGNLIDDTSPIELPESSNLASVKLISDGSQWYKIVQKDLSETVASDNLIGWWKLDEVSGITAEDASGENNDGILTSATFSSNSTLGKVKNALSFDGVDDRIRADSSNFGMAKNFTVMAWVFDSDSDVGNIISNGSPWDYRMYIHSSNKLYAQVSLDDTSSGYFSSNGTIPSEEWAHVAFMFDGSTIKIYINGSLDKSSSHVGEVQTPNNNTVYLGTYGSGEYFQGNIDDARIYNRVLTSSEIQAIYNQGQ